MLLSVLGETEDVVDVHPNENPRVVSKNVICDTLECRCRIVEAKGHNNPFKGLKLRVERGFFDFFVIDSYLMKPTDKIYLRKDGGPPQCTQYSFDPRQEISISNSSGIQGSLVNAYTPFTIRFSHQQATRSIWT